MFTYITSVAMYVEILQLSEEEEWKPTLKAVLYKTLLPFLIQLTSLKKKHYSHYITKKTPRTHNSKSKSKPREITTATPFTYMFATVSELHTNGDQESRQDWNTSLVGFSFCWKANIAHAVTQQIVNSIIIIYPSFSKTVRSFKASKEQKNLVSPHIITVCGKDSRMELKLYCQHFQGVSSILPDDSGKASSLTVTLSLMSQRKKIDGRLAAGITYSSLAAESL